MSLNKSFRMLLTRETGALLLVFLVALAYLIHWHASERAALEKRFIGEQLAVASEKSAALEAMLKGIYQNVRTITLLPSVRAIRGGNRVSFL